MVSQVSFSTRRVDEALPVLGHYFEGVRISKPQGSFAFDFEGRDAGLFQSIEYRLVSPGSTSAVDTAGTLSVGMLRSGKLELEGPNGPIDSSVPWLFPEGETRGRWDEVRLRIVSLSLEDVNEIARGLVGDENASLHFTSTGPRTPALGRQWGLLTSTIMEAMDVSGSIAGSELVKASAFAHLAAVLLATFPNNAMQLERPHYRPWGAPMPVRRALSFMEENAHLPITSAEIASAARLSVRGLQYAFRETIGETPTARLRRIRMQRAHADLQAGDPATTSVRSIALRWGFEHAGRFSQYYRETFGGAPSQTLAS